MAILSDKENFFVSLNHQEAQNVTDLRFDWIQRFKV